MGLIDTLSAGYGVVNRRPWLLLVPLVVDLFLWLGPRISLAPVVDPALLQLTWLARLGSPAPGDPAAVLTGPELERLRQSLMASTSQTNALTILARGPLALPSVSAGLGGIGPFSFTDGAGALAWLAGGLAAGLLLGGFFRAILAQQVRGEGGHLAGALRRTPADVLRVLGLLGVQVGVLLLLGLPVLLIVAAAALVAPAIAALGLLLLLLGVFVAELHLFFALEAIFVSGVGPLAAVQRSVAVVRRHTGATLGLVLLTWLILAGMGQVWAVLATLLEPLPLAVGLSMAGNAYIASGLVAASMLFYQQRADLLPQGVRHPVLSPQG